MTWLLWGLGAYVGLSLVIGGFSAWIAWDYNPWDAFVGGALFWPVLVWSFVRGG